VITAGLGEWLNATSEKSSSLTCTFKMFSAIPVSGVGLLGSYCTRYQELQWEALPSLCSRGM